MYNAVEETLYRPFDESKVLTPVDRHIKTLIEELYCSFSLNKTDIAYAVDGLLREFDEEYYYMHEEEIKARDITVTYADTQNSFAHSFGHWITCLDPISGEMNYHNLLMGSMNFENKKLVVFMDTYGAVDAIVKQLTTFIPLDDNILGGALVFLAKRYGVAHEDVLYMMPNAKRVS